MYSSCLSSLRSPVSLVIYSFLLSFPSFNPHSHFIHPFPSSFNSSTFVFHPSFLQSFISPLYNFACNPLLSALLSFFKSTFSFHPLLPFLLQSLHLRFSSTIPPPPFSPSVYRFHSLPQDYSFTPPSTSLRISPTTPPSFLSSLFLFRSIPQDFSTSPPAFAFHPPKPLLHPPSPPPLPPSLARAPFPKTTRLS